MTSPTTTTLDDAIAETKDALQPISSKLPLSTKLLTKPPFRFIHDIVVATLKATSFPNGLFREDELDSSNYKDSKTAKVAFLTKLISLVNVGIGSELEVLPTKIVAGLEPLNTNILLAAFGKLAQDKSIDRTALIQHCLGGTTTTTTTVDTTQGGVEAPPMPSPPADDTEPTEPEYNNAIVPHSSIIKDQVAACNEDIVQTRDMISALIAKPKCSDKLLSKPPFRFLHDIIMAIGEATQFDLRLIFSEDELISSNVKDKQPKLKFLEKLITFIESSVDMSSINVKPAKIISGLEPERTRYLLQLFTVVATSLNQCLVPTVEVDDAKEDKAIPTEQPRIKETKEVENDGAKEELTASEPQIEDTKEADDDMEVDTANETADVRMADVCDDANVDTAVDVHLPEEENISHNNDTITADESPNPTELLEDAAPLKSADLLEDAVPLKSTSILIPTERPATAHGGGRQSSSVIGDRNNSPITNASNVVRPATAIINGRGGGGGGVATSNDMSIFPYEEEEAKTNVGASNNSIMHDKKIRQQRTTRSKVTLPTKLSDVDFNSLADAIQSIAQSAAPLGKYRDGIQDDIEVMVNERNYMITEQDDASEEIAPLHAQLHLLENNLENQVQVLKRLEAAVSKNNEILKKHGVAHVY